MAGGAAVGLILGLAFVGALLLSFSYYIVRMLQDPLETRMLSTFVCTCSIAMSLLLCAVVPFDIYATSMAHVSHEFMQHSYYVTYGTFSIWVGVVIPFTYFFLGQDSSLDDLHIGEKIANAAKYTLFFIVALLGAFLLGLTLRPGHWTQQAGTEKWIQDLFDTHHSGHYAVLFTVACLAAVGHVIWVVYAGWGLGALPVSLIRGKKSLRSEQVEAELDLVRVRERVKALESRGGPRRRRERQALATLTKQLRAMEGRAAKLYSAQRSALSRVLTALAPFRVLFGFLLLSLSLLLLSAVAIAAVDKALHSMPGSGYVLSSPQLFNPLDVALVYLSARFPLDYVALALAVAYVFACVLYSLLSLGLRLCCLRLITVRRRATSPQALLILGCILMFAILAFSLQLPAMAPQYATFGSQTAAVSSAPRGLSAPTSVTDVVCTLDLAASNSNVAATAASAGSSAAAAAGSDDTPAITNHCKMSQISQVVSRITVSMPVFGAVFYYGDWLLVAIALLSLLVSACREKADNFGVDDGAASAADIDKEERTGLLAATSADEEL